MPNTNSKLEQKKVVVVGGGPVGCAVALYMERRGYKVEVYEMRQDPRRSLDKMAGKSINLTLSNRGLSALEKINLKHVICDKAIKCYGRMIHDRNKKTRISPYGENKEVGGALVLSVNLNWNSSPISIKAILSVNREILHRELIEAVDRCTNTTIHFDHKLVGTNFEKGEVTFQTPDPNRADDDKNNITMTVTLQADVIFGCDGANSCMRKYMNRESNLSYKEEGIDERYTEFTLPATEDNKFAMEANFLHVWPRDESVLLALPNSDCSFTVTLFMPSKVFESLKEREAATNFVHENFPDAVPLIGEKKIVDRLTGPGNAHSLMWTKCSRFNIGGKVLLLGDAAHAMVPFYGQGVNCGFEDLAVLDKLLDLHNEDFEKAMDEFSELRTADTGAMCDLSLENYNVLKKKVNTTWLSCRKKIDSVLYRMFPNTWIPIYTMVAFSDMRYSDCVKNKQWQDKVIKVCAGLTTAVVSTLVFTGLFVYTRSS